MPPPAIMEGEGKAISAAEAAAYKKAGVLVKHGFFDAREVAAMQRTVREFKRSELLYDSEPCTSLLGPLPVRVCDRWPWACAQCTRGRVARARAR